jgi:hypothetical protein
MITLKQRILAGLLLSRGSRGCRVSPIQARGASPGHYSVSGCTVPIPLSIQSAWLLRSSADHKGFRAICLGGWERHTPYYQVYGEEPLTQPPIRLFMERSPGRMEMETRRSRPYPSPIDGSNYNVCASGTVPGRCDPLSVRLYDVVTRRWTGLAATDHIG